VPRLKHSLQPSILAFLLPLQSHQNRTSNQELHTPLQSHVAGVFNWTTFGALNYFAFHSHLVICASIHRHFSTGTVNFTVNKSQNTVINRHYFIKWQVAIGRVSEKSVGLQNTAIPMSKDLVQVS